MVLNISNKYMFLPFLRLQNNLRSLCDYTRNNLIKSSNQDATSKCINGEDLSVVTPYFSNTFNLAAYVNSSETLQKLIKLNVNLSKIEKKPVVAEKLLRLDFNTNMNDHIVFLSDYIDFENMGDFITKNPMIFFENLEDLKVRVNYLISKQFDDIQIKRILTKNPFWLMFSTLRIDKRLGFFQEQFKLFGKELRYLACSKPKLITYNLMHVQNNLFIIKEEMGFEDHEIKQLILSKPKLWMLNSNALSQRFNYIHNVMHIPHNQIKRSPEVLLCRNFRLRQRHTFLETLGRAQYDPKNENFIPLKTLVEGTDLEFCTKYAKCSINDFNDFLKTL